MSPPNRQSLILSLVRSCAGLAVAITASSELAIAAPPNNPFVLDFEGLADFETIGEFYAGGPGGSGSYSGFDFGITFSENALALIDADDGGQSGNFGGEATPDTVLFFRSGPAAIMNMESGFQKGFSLYYSAIALPGKVNIYDGLDGAGNLLASFDLPKTPLNGAPDPTGQFSPFLPAGTSFEGVAYSVSFEGAARRIGFDNVTLGAASPLPGSTSKYAYMRPDDGPTKVPEPSAVLGLLGIAGLGRRVARRKR